MKLNRFYFAALAAMTIASCSNEQDLVVPGSPELKPGEALVTFDVRGKITSRANDSDEKAIRSIAYRLYNADPQSTTKDSVEITRISTTLEGKIQFKVAADKVTEFKGKPMKLLVAINSANDLNYQSLSDALMAKENKNLDNEFQNTPSGLPASVDVDFMMEPGPLNIAPTYKAKRIVSRIYVKKHDSSTGNINGITINVKNVADEAYLFNKTYIPGVGTRNAATFVVNGEDSQPVAYVYPTESGASVDVSLNGVTKPFSLPQLEGNKNYSITIKTHTSSGDSDGQFDVAIDEWDTPDGGDVDANLTGISLNNEFKDGTIAVENGKLAVKVYGSSEIQASDLFLGNVQLIDLVTTRATALDGFVSSDGVVKAKVTDGKLILTVENTTVGEADKEYTIEINAKVDGKNDKISLPIVAKGYPENFSVNINGVEIMTVGIQDRKGAIDPSAIIDIVNAVNKMDGRTYAEKSRAYVQQDQNANERKYMGQRIALPQENDCPRGFEVPTMNQIRQIFGVSSARLPVEAMQGATTKIIVNQGATVTEGFNDYPNGASGNSMRHLGTPHNHYIFSYQDNGQTKEFYIPRGDKNGIGTPANNFLFSGSDSNFSHGRFIVWQNEVQMREGVSSVVGSTNWLRCVRKPKNTNP